MSITMILGLVGSPSIWSINSFRKMLNYCWYIMWSLISYLSKPSAETRMVRLTFPQKSYSCPSWGENTNSSMQKMGHCSTFLRQAMAVMNFFRIYFSWGQSLLDFPFVFLQEQPISPRCLEMMERERVRPNSFSMYLERSTAVQNLPWERDLSISSSIYLDFLYFRFWLREASSAPPFTFLVARYSRYLWRMVEQPRPNFQPIDFRLKELSSTRASSFILQVTRVCTYLPYQNSLKILFISSSLSGVMVVLTFRLVLPSSSRFLLLLLSLSCCFLRVFATLLYYQILRCRSSSLQSWFQSLLGGQVCPGKVRVKPWRSLFLLALWDCQGGQGSEGRSGEVRSDLYYKKAELCEGWERMVV